MPGYVLDTCFFGELARPRPQVSVAAWFQRHDADCYLTPVVAMELDDGVELLPDAATRQKLRDRNRRLVARFKPERRIIFDYDAAAQTADILAHARRRGRPVGIPDAQILGIAASMRFAVVTRDANLDGRGVTIINPWTDNP